MGIAETTGAVQWKISYTDTNGMEMVDFSCSTSTIYAAFLSFPASSDSRTASSSAHLFKYSYGASSISKTL